VGGEFIRVGCSFQTAVRAKPAQPEGDIASDVASWVENSFGSAVHFRRLSGQARTA